MADPKLEIEKRMDRLEEGLRYVADKAIYTEDQEALEKILRGEKLEKVEDGDQ